MPGQVGPDGLERAEADHDRVLLVAEEPDDDWWRMCVRQADQLVLVAPWTARAPEGPPLGRTDADLVLVGARPPRDQVRSWAASRRGRWSSRRPHTGLRLADRSPDAR
jgi:hypothetical protein